MSSLRLLLILLVGLNLLALAAIRGWLGAPDSPGGEPERLTNQLHPERIRLQLEASTGGTNPAPPRPAPEAPAPPATTIPTPTRASAAASPAACVTLSGLSASEADSLAAGIAAETFTVSRGTTATTTSWWVRIPPAPNRETADRKIRELRALGITDLYLVQESGPSRHAISLGLFKGEAAARQHLAMLRNKGVRGVEISPRQSTSHWLEIRGPAELLTSVASEFSTTFPDAERGECPP